jgi:hypothetical protein
MLLDRDPRWVRLNAHEWTCPCCGLKHGGLFDLVYSKPDSWPGDAAPRPNSEVLTSSNILTEDFCILNGEHFFVRCLLRLPLVTKPDISFGFGIWASLSSANFDLYLETFDGGEQGDLGPWFGWFSNRLNGYPDTMGLKCNVQPQADRQRPLILLEPTQHPLAVEQRAGVTFDRVLELYALYGHDLRTVLSD